MDTGVPYCLMGVASIAGEKVFLSKEVKKNKSVCAYKYK
jgi:hypothetical protein